MSETLVLTEVESPDSAQIAALEAVWNLPPATDALGHRRLTPPQYSEAEADLPLAIRVQDLPQEALVQQEFARGVGSLAVGKVVERPAGRKSPILENLR